MKVNFRAINYSADSKLVEFTEKRIDKVSHFFDRVIEVDVFTKVENASDRVNKFAELRIHIPGNDIVVKKTCKSFEEAIDSATRVAERMLRKRKEKLRA